MKKNLMALPLDIYDQIVVYFQSPDFRQIIFLARVISYSISVILIFSIIILVSRARAIWWMQESLDSFRKLKLPDKIKKDWQKINNRLEKDDEASLKLAVVEADQMLDEVLKRMGLEGKDMGERLEQMGSQQFKSYDGVLEAHRLRDLIIHQKDLMVTKEQAQIAVAEYEESLKELEVL
ncbi:MAG: hypothetical protein A2Y98_03255 [Candidatus Portnoybacteria bacterium RBG_19FT_COMBO_36_7]|uniref:Uncharacterized protein n=1 Tax=Candidatus Portnoybacteria bacterium RBG_19FT_COMBO_36_7 TaxID=1801992 RepID=A0A1G2F805_9BACT|nr:MAG: hypothetical protein A2Y98_03255 [Candidatus Portnoybacteria bacterium RBG_19FT_COMBO_36_7]